METYAQTLRSALHDNPLVLIDAGNGETRKRFFSDPCLEAAANVVIARFAAEVDALITPILKISGALDESDVEKHSHLVVKLRALLNSRQNT